MGVNGPALAFLCERVGVRGMLGTDTGIAAAAERLIDRLVGLRTWGNG